MRSSLSASLHAGNVWRRPTVPLAAVRCTPTPTTLHSQASNLNLRASCAPLTPLRNFSVCARRLAASPDITPLRKQLKSEAKARKAAKRNNGPGSKKDDVLKDWELTVGIEVHAQLDTDAKLFSSMRSGGSLRADGIMHAQIHMRGMERYGWALTMA
ncbi:Carnitine O-acetyltransferase mitochondrial [Ascosphaera pollenicola]|nr:Carnitine O-acetyltransferase mitochondrial [Ascosphaera pollenicola]